jgi:polysaccharide biosynthesis/export protein
MKGLHRFLIPALAAFFAAACTASSIDTAPGGAQLGESKNTGQPAAQGGGAPHSGPAQAAAGQSGAAQSAAAPAGASQDPIEKVAQTYTAMSDPKSKAYKIGPLDVLDITVFKVPDLTKTVQVSEAGTINFPLVGEIKAGGRSARELEQELTRLLGAKYLQNPQITVFVKEYNSQRVTITGAVKKPGVVPMVGGMTLLQAIAQSGGLEDTAESTAVVMRVSDGKRLAGRYDVSDIQEGRANDPQLQSGDVIVVPTSDTKQGLNMFLKVLPLATLAPLM